MITSEELRRKWLDFYKSKGHVDIGSVSLIGDGETGVMFNVAGMQPLMPYLLGKMEHSAGKRLCNVQGCIRTVDIDNIGDETHFTFFEMMGNWSIGDYFKKEKTQWTFELLTKEFGLNPDKICSTVFAGSDSVPKDNETAELLENIGIKKENIFFLKDNWWNLEGTVGTPCGPDNEWFYPKSDKAKDLDEDYVEIGNDVYMQFEQLGNGQYKELKYKNVDTGFGFERNLAFLNNVTDCYKTDLFTKAIKKIENATEKKYGEDKESTRAIRIICDHTRTAVMLIGDIKGILPSNVGAGYILRRLMRRAIRYIKKLGGNASLMKEVAQLFIDDVYKKAYPHLLNKKSYILGEIENESNRFEKTLEQGIKEFERVVENLQKFAPDVKKIAGQKAFRLFDTFGFPIELTIELAEEKGYDVDIEGYEKAFAEHQEKSRVAAAGMFKGGLADTSEMTTKLHTATHLLLAALRKFHGEKIHQCGSNITPERLRFDFNFDRKMTDEEVKQIENEVNENIRKAIPVICEELPIDKARECGATGIFDDKYGEVVKVYTIENVSKEMCGGPHAQNTADLKHFKIVKEESSSSGVRRIKAILD
ncbi:MAG: alanine--tRNA ligase [Clostridia bacterium]|nr:alanine--tRNA ligase [Clostridia bacterium]